MTKYLRFSDLQERGIVGSRPTLARWVKSNGFPPGKHIGPNTRVWTEAEIQDWLSARETAA